MDVFLATLGCRLNEAELEQWSRALAGGGHRVVDAAERAQVMVLNSCAVTAEAARKSRKEIGRLHRANPSARLVVTGCFAALEPDRAAALAGVDLVVGNADKDALVERIATALDPTAMPERATEPEGSHVYRAGRTRAFVKVQDGCRNRCTFCIVTVARGDERSRPADELLAELDALADAGYQEAVLTGVHLGGYGSDLGTDLFALVQMLLSRSSIPRIRLSSLEPWDLPPHFWELWSDARLMPHLHLPLQSGSDPVLRRMARRCSTGAFASLVADARAAIADLNVTTDLIVGFPGETDADFDATLELVAGIGFGHIHIFTYSAREGTTAARLPGHVPGRVKRERSRALHALAGRMKAEHLARHAGDTRDVLWEGAGERLPDGNVRHGGYTDNYLRVEAVVPAGVDLENRIIPTTLAYTGDDVLDGTPAELPARRSGRVALRVI